MRFGRLAKDAAARAASLIAGRLGRVPVLDAEGWRYAHVSFSQCGEDLLIRLALEAVGHAGEGFWVDVGAFHPVWYSNTYALSLDGWSGINIDANREHVRLFEAARPRDVNLHCAVSDSNEPELTFLGYPHGTTGRVLSPGETDRGSLLGEAPTSEQRVAVRSLAAILAEHRPREKTFALLNVDCEGHDLAVLRSNDWSRDRPLVVCVEDTDTGPTSEILRFLVDRGYVESSRALRTRILADLNARPDPTMVHPSGIRGS